MGNLDWNAGAWEDSFWLLKNRIARDGNRADRDALRKLRVDAYWNTVNLVRFGKYKSEGGWYCFDDAEVDAMVRGTRMYRECFDVRGVAMGVEFKNKFRLIDFAILEDHNSNLQHNREGNYLPFAEEMGCYM